MSENIFKGLFDSDTVSVIAVSDFLLCIAAAIVIGLLLTAVYMHKSRYTKGFVTTLALLPAVVSVVIMMVNGNVGTGVAVAGTFSLVRFRSVPGTAKEISALFLAMGTGLVVGMGYIAYAFLFAIVLGLATLVYNQLDFGLSKKGQLYKTLHITIPEDLNYSDVFDEVFLDYTSSYELVQVKTTNMGSLFRLTYNLTLTQKGIEKEFIDKLRCRNGNLEIIVNKQETNLGEL